MTNYSAIKELVAKYKGTINNGINWTWAVFPSDEDGRTCFVEAQPYIEEHRGYYPGRTEDEGYHWGGFRFR